MRLLRLLIVSAVMIAAGLSFSASPFGAAAATITVSPLTVSPTSVAAGGTVTFTAGLTANAKLSAYPVEFSVAAPGGASSTYKLLYLNFTAGKTLTEAVTWTAPANAAAGSYTLSVTAFTPNWGSVEGSKSTTFTVTGTTPPVTPPAATAASAPGPNSSVFAAPFYSCVRNFYVSTTGKDTNAGTAASPWLTIEHADSTSRTGGDCINVAPGTYKASVLVSHGGTGPTATGYVAYRCQTLDGCHVLATGQGHVWGIRQPANFVVIDGFEIDGNNALQTDGIADSCIGSDGDTYGTGNSSHHIWVLNNILHHCNMAGISFNNKEWYYIIHNTAYHNAFTSGAQGSGIDLVVVQCIESGNSSCASGSSYAGGTGTYTPSGQDLTSAPFHNVISDNIVYDNMIASSNPAGCGGHTDGNGIILDSWLDETTNTITYPYQTLVAGNVAYGNGGRGIHLFRASNVTVANNTAYGNGTDTCINSYGLGDLSQSGGSNNVWISNVAQSVLTAANSSCGAYCGHNNVPLIAGNGAGVVDTNNTYLNNVFYGGVGAGVMTYGSTGLGLYDNDVKYFSTANNKVNTNPLLSAPASANFAVKTGSPAIGYGKTESYLPATAVTSGACASSLTTCP